MSNILFSQISSLSSEPNIENRARIEKFLQYTMIDNGCIYTLMGSKPITTFNLVPVKMDDQEKRAIYEVQSAQLKKYIPFQKFQPSREDCKQLWKDWKHVEKKYMGNQFIFVEYEKWEAGMLINIPSAISIFKEYYKDFVKINRKDFDPEKAVYLIGSKDPFWKKIERSHYLLGILLGFGQKNSQYFQTETVTGKWKPTRKPSDLERFNLTNLQDAPLPIFVTYDPSDEQIEKYKLEKEQILKMYKDQDFLELTLKMLGRNIGNKLD